MTTNVTTASATRALTRRQALIGATAVGVGAWAAPAFSTIDSAAAMSCVSGTVDWDAFATGSTFTGATINGVTVSVAVAPIFGTTLLSTNRTIRAGPNGSVNQKALQFQQLPNGFGRGQTVTFSFSSAVTNLQLTIYDIDSLYNGWGDRIEILTPGYTWSIPFGGEVRGSGTAFNPFYSRQGNTNFNDFDSRGNLTLSYKGPITTFAFRYTNQANTGGGNQRIAISDISWSC